MKKLTLLASAMMLSHAAYAVENGLPVTQTEYDNYNYIVQTIDVSDGSSCGAQLIASNWLLTARHCTPYYTDNKGDWANDPAYLGESMDIKVYQGVEGKNKEENLIYSGEGKVYSFGGDNEGENLLLENAKQFEHVTNFVECIDSNNCSNNNKISHNTGVMSDIVLIKLSKDVPYSTTLKLEPTQEYPVIKNRFDLADYQSKTKPIYNINDELEFRGFGKTETGQEPETMMKGSLIAKQLGFELDCNVYLTSEGFADCTDENLNSVNFDSTRLSIEHNGSLDFYQTTSDVNPGDSGTAITTQTNQLIGIASRDDSDGGIFVGVDSLLPWVQSTVNGLNAPKHVVLTEGSVKHQLDVQNMSSVPMVVTPVVTDGIATLTDNCPQTLEPLEVCTINVVGELNDDSTFTVALNGSHEVTYEAKSTTTDPVEPDPDTKPSNGGGSGGSIGFYILPFLCLIGLLRRKH
ncbi:MULTISPECIES: GlyGly-CTERM sorting domain-containing protein [Vibrio]|jgi:V8-like Glu-specific endopeptidase|uniref:GlyGly-CTERM sorting domain-containing protein n=1 Tax=Vibrio TaxID=662 RepID=UPI0008418C6C|nr:MULTISPECIES: GlyGly-CTERM sorting domain-containing protein [Vibrio]ODM56960.1 hypothetical protein BC455_17870 [Vibrio harveyi]USD58437.1 trypsin-like serine protease [Vibrio sp. SCSIO 43155]